MMLTLLVDHANRALSQLRGELCLSVHSSIFSKVRASAKPGAVHIVKSAVGLLSLGKSDFEAIERFRNDRFFKEVLGLSKTPGSVWMRQRLDAKAGAIRELADALSLRLIERTEAPITPHKGYICADLVTPL
jgi:hypothetical protein